MNKRLLGIAEQALFATVVFVLILLAFADRLAVPVWLQPIGRMHPLFLHFPIVILLLTLVMEVFRFRPVRAGQTAETVSAYRQFLDALLLVGTLSAGLTVVMGLFLATEDDYSGTTLQWHKWSGVGVFLVAAFIYWARQKRWYNAPLARVGGLVGIVCLVGAGHYGATLTHGDNFLFEPLSRQAEPERVPLEQALVYDHLVQPIFEQKCVSCHNPGKLKGGLNLTHLAAVQKGGKSGKLYVSGRPDISLLLQRIHLPLEEKKHMPPIGKSQLTPQEAKLLALWIKGRAQTNGRVADLPATDSLRIIAAGFLAPSVSVESFDFDEPDEDMVRQLNTDYRTVARLANGSPALAVNLYNRANYAPDQLTDLSPVREQVVSLSLNKLPVKDADLKELSQFENLQKLDLNFTDITGKALEQLTPLKQLKTLALAGTSVRYEDLVAPLKAFKNLQTVALWNTRLTSAQIAQLQKSYGNVRFIAGFNGAAAEPIRLNPPQLKNASPIFTGSTQVDIRHPVRGVQIRYTTDGSEPDSLRSPILTAQTTISQPTQIKARAFKAGWYGSSTATFDYYRRTYKPDSLRLLLPFNPVHQANGPQSFFDGILGTFNANSPAWANNWLGFRKNEMALLSRFAKPVTISSVALRIMVEEETSIFPPGEVEIWGGPSPNELKRLATVKPRQPGGKEPHTLQTVTCSFGPQAVSWLKIVAHPLKQIPAWHPNKGNQALLLVDEIFIN
ncbi:cytochrome C [Rudanella paleaurantiibacter]|uniref:Cytochrome C n=1 Tax=Rudanella paleaurantiibacter TaxID=2614655 RepID=A0A7J5U3D7_9BACT|nr:c-type cytochrome domain-containing protein [Rudanella paleaurantiibacter]KAB7732220.1 cytochrome C [Rudanella paleaurantiibacter]